MKINNDGSIQGQTFSGEDYKGEYPRPIEGETYRNYHERVEKCVEQGFHLGDLSWSDWQDYCMGSGNFEGVSSFEIIGEE